MIKRSVGRNTRAKGVRVKQIVQILLVIGVCIWLIYLVKHSHDEKKGMHDDGEERLSGKTQNEWEFLKLGRKDLHPRVDEVSTSEEEEDETGGEEDEERKHEEDDPREDNKEENREEEETKHEEPENGGRDGGDEEIDGNAGFIDDEKDKDDGEEETEIDEKGDKEMEEEEISTEDDDRDDGNEITHESREEQYNRDDASSAVTHDTRVINVETDDTNLDSNDLEHKEKPRDLEETNLVNDNSRITDKTTEDGISLRLDWDQTKADNKSPRDSILATRSIEQNPEANDKNQVNTEAGETLYSSTDNQNIPVNISTNEHSGLEVSSKSSNETESVQPEETDSRSSEVDGESGVTEEGTDGENGSENAAREDPIDSFDSRIAHEMEDTRIDLETLPEISTEVDNSDETAAE